MVEYKATKGSNIRKYCGGRIFLFLINKYSKDQFSLPFESHVIEDHASVVILTVAKDIYNKPEGCLNSLVKLFGGCNVSKLVCVIKWLRVKLGNNFTRVLSN